MIKANELRIGNVFHDEHGCKSTVFNILQSYVRCYVDSDIEEKIIYYEDLKPIPLTEEWLNVFGFEKYNKKKNEEYIDEYDDCEDIFQNIIDLGLFDGKYYLIHIGANYVEEKSVYKMYKGCEYVHQLQNLCKELTGEELTIE